MRLHLDIETYSEQDLKKGGLYRYAEHPSAEILCAAFRFGDGPVQLWIPFTLPERFPKMNEFHAHVFTGAEVPAELRTHIEAGKPVAAHNAAFERVVLNGVAGQKLNFPKIGIEQCHCTMAKVRVHGLPGGLEDAAAALGTFPKQSTGTNNMRSLCKPRTGEEKRYAIEKYPEKYVELYLYCIDDVKAESDLDRVVPDLTPEEVEVWRLDQRINDRGISVDLAAVADVQVLIREYQVELEALCTELTGLKPSQNAKIAAWVRAHPGCDSLPDLQAETVRAWIKDPQTPAVVKRVLRTYSSYAAAVIKKFPAMVRAVCADGRLHGMFMFYGANTGRWASVIVQLQNLLRPLIKDCDAAIDAFKDRDLGWIKALWAGIDPMKVFGSCIRGMLIAGKGKELLAVDFAGIESRITAWVSGEEWKVKAFEDFDAGTGPDTYKLAYSRTFQIDVDDVTKDQRQVGKVIELAVTCYEGGVGAFVTMVDTYGVNLAELAEAAWGKLPVKAMESAEWMWEKGYLKAHDLPYKTVLVCDAIKWSARSNHPRTTQNWKDLKAAAIAAIENPGKAYSIPSKLIHFKIIDRWLYLRLPSGRRIAYLDPSLGDDGAIHYMGVDTDSRRWMKCSTYGGKLMQNIAEGVGRDLLVHAMLAMERAGAEPIGSVHDEGIFEIPEGQGDEALIAAIQIFTAKPAWAKGLPIAAEGFVARRYRK